MNNEQQSVLTLKLRVTPDLKQKIIESSEKYNRSMNADMVARLEQSFSTKEASNMSLEDYKIAAQEVFKDTVVAHLKKYDDNRMEAAMLMVQQQNLLIEQLRAEKEASFKK